jgi:hypothetical protein
MGAGERWTKHPAVSGLNVWDGRSKYYKWNFNFDWRWKI